MIQRFEDEYPETKLPIPRSEPISSSPPLADIDSRASSYADASILSASTDTNGISRITSANEAFALDDDASADEPYALKLSRTSSNTSLASRALTQEEGRMHRYGQSVRREIALADDKNNDAVDASSASNSLTSDEALQTEDRSRLKALEERLSNMRGEEIAMFRERCNNEGVEKALQDLGVTAQELLVMERSDPEAFERFRESQVAARINAGRC